MSCFESSDMAAINLPSGEQRGLNKCSEPGTSERVEVLRSTTWMFGPEALPYSSHGMSANTMELPSAVQVGSPWFTLSEEISCGVPPCALTTKIFHGLPGWDAMKAIRVPSGDQRGRCAFIGTNVS